MKIGVDYIGVGVGAVIYNNDGLFFLAQRGKGTRNEHFKWEFPGGGLEYGELLRESIVREVNEEFGMHIQVEKLLDVVDHIIPEEKQHWVSPSYLCKYIDGNPRILEPEKCEAFGWFTLEQIEKMDISIASASNFRALKEYLKENGSVLK